MDREQQRPRRRTASASGGKSGKTPERRHRSPEASGDKPISRDRRSRTDGQPGHSQRPASRREEAQRQRAAQERQHRRKQQLRRQKQQKKIEREEKRRSEAQRRPVKPLVRRTLFLRLGATLAVVIALVVAMTFFFKVETVQVSGNVKYTAQEVIDASGIEIGENLLILGKSGVAGRIHAALPYVGDIQVGIKLPNTVNIDIVEQSAVYTIEDNKGGWWLLSSTGTVLESATESNMEDYIQLQGILADTPVIGEQFSPVQTEGESTEIGGTALERRAAALEIMAELTEADRSGEVTGVDVSDLYDIQVWYGNTYQVLLDGPTDLSYKVRYMAQAIEELSAEGYRGGVLDLSFRDDQRSVFTPW